MTEPLRQTCQCVYRYKGIVTDTCSNYADPNSGEAQLCENCMKHPKHQQANNVPKRLPKRSLA